MACIVRRLLEEIGVVAGRYLYGLRMYLWMDGWMFSSSKHASVEWQGPGQFDDLEHLDEEVSAHGYQGL
jgi:hypothetical protein